MLLRSAARKIVLLSIFATLAFALERFCHKQTDGFFVSKIRIAFLSDRERPLHSQLVQSDRFIEEHILSQPLHYIGRGGQCYAFATQDEQFVVKLLKYNNNYPRIWFALFPFPFGLESYRQANLQRKQMRLDAEYRSYQIALEELPEETGLIYFHLHQGGLKNITLHLQDKLGISHFLNADQYQFYIQKKGTPFYPALEKMIHENRIDEAKLALTEFSSYLLRRCKKGINDGDAGICKNFAFQDLSHPFQIDIGQFSYDLSIAQPEISRKNLLIFTDGFVKWLDQNKPELAEYLIKSIKEESEKETTR